MNTILALLAFSQRQPSIAGDLASEVVATETSPTRPRIESLRLLARLAYQRREFATAVKHYRELTQYQSEPHDFFQLGVAEQNSGDSAKAVIALQRAVELAPSYVEAHRALSAILQSQGRRDEAARHAQLANQHGLRLQRLQRAMQP